MLVAGHRRSHRRPEAGRWRLSLVQTGPLAVLLDGEVVLDGTGTAPPAGRDFFGARQQSRSSHVELRRIGP